MLRREPCESCQDVVAWDAVGAWGRDAVLEGYLAAEPARACPVDRPVDGDAMEPRPERPPTVEAIEAAQGCEECLLRDVLSRGCIVSDEIRSAQCAWPVRPEEGLEVR